MSQATEKKGWERILADIEKAAEPLENLADEIGFIATEEGMTPQDRIAEIERRLRDARALITSTLDMTWAAKKAVRS